MLYCEKIRTNSSAYHLVPRVNYGLAWVPEKHQRLEIVEHLYLILCYDGCMRRQARAIAEAPNGT